jgi:hypothetical protein
MSRDRAAYMRSYRAAIRATKDPGVTLIGDQHLASLMAQISSLEEEVRHLKLELARRPPALQPHVAAVLPADGFNTRPFTPVPKSRK